MVLKIKAVNVSLWPKVQRSEHPLPEASVVRVCPLLWSDSCKALSRLQSSPGDASTRSSFTDDPAPTRTAG